VADAQVTHNAIERLKTEPGRKTKTKVITLANHSKRKQRQYDHGENTCDQVTNLNSGESSVSFQTNQAV